MIERAYQQYPQDEVLNGVEYLVGMGDADPGQVLGRGGGEVMDDEEPRDERYPEYEYRPQRSHDLFLFNEQPLQPSPLEAAQGEDAVFDGDFFL